MNKILRAVGYILLTFIVSTPTFGQLKKDLFPQLDGRDAIIINIDGKRAKRDIINIFEITTRPYFRDPDVPRFVLSDRKGNYALGIGGYIRTVAEYGFDRVVDNVDFITADIPIGAPYQNNQFQMDFTTSLIFLKLVGHNKLLGHFVAYTDGNFRGSGNTLTMRHAYISFRGFTIGHDEGLFLDLAALPPTIDFAGPDGLTYYRATQVRYEKEFLGCMKFGVGIENPGIQDINTSIKVPNTDIETPFKDAIQRYPNIPAYLQYTWNKRSHIRLNGIFRSMSYIDPNNEVKSRIGMGIQGSTTIGIDKFQIYGQYTYGKGIGSYLNDLSVLNVDLVPNYDDPNKMQALPMVGWFAGLQYNISKKVFCSATYSACYLNSRKGFGENNPDFYNKGQYMVANAFWNVTHDLQVGAEYVHGYKRDFSKRTGNANRINLCAQYNF